MSTTTWWKTLPTWNAYPLDPTQYPERPWWRAARRWGATVVHRSDLVTLERGHERYPLDPDADPDAHREGRWVYRVRWSSENKLHAGWVHDGGDWIDALAAYDALHPLTAPPPRAGQVWELMTPAGICTTVVQIALHAPTDGMFRYLLSGEGPADLRQPRHWPLPGAALVAGAFAPWGPEAAGRADVE